MLHELMLRNGTKGADPDGLKHLSRNEIESACLLIGLLW